MQGDLPEDGVAWSPYHYQDEDGTWCAGVEYRGITTHDEAVQISHMVEQAILELMAKLNIPEVTRTH